MPLAPIYKGARGEVRPARRGAPGGVLLPPGVGLPPFLVGLGEGGKEEGERKERGAPPPSPCPIRTRGGGARGPALSASPLLQYGPLNPRGVPVTPRYSGKIPISLGTLPISKYRLPIYQSSCLSHFETPRHVRDHIRDSEQPSVHQDS